jgi:microcystin-dependent protein
MWTTNTAPTDWLICDGAAVNRTTYATLFALVGTTYGVGNGSTTFNLPNLKGAVAVGRDSAQTEFDTLGETGGAKTHTLTSTEMPSHTHTQNAHSHGYSDPTHAHYQSGIGLAANGSRAGLVNQDGVGFTSTGFSATGITISNATATNQNTGGGGAHNNLQPYTVLNYIIKAL